MGGGGARGSKWTAPSVLDRLFLYEFRLLLFRATIVSFPSRVVLLLGLT